MSTDSSMSTANKEKLGFRQKLGFGLGDIFGGGSGIVIGFYYLYFLTDVVRIDPALAGTVLFISRIYDAITDPLEGILADRTRTRLGRRRPYLIAGAPLVLLSFFLLFYPVDFADPTTRFVFVLAAYLFFSTVVSIVMLSYNALQAEMTLDYHERASLSSFRIFSHRCPRSSVQWFRSRLSTDSLMCGQGGWPWLSFWASSLPYPSW